MGREEETDTVLLVGEMLTVHLNYPHSTNHALTLREREDS